MFEAKKVIPPSLACGLALASCWWMLSPSRFFIADDWYFLYSSKFDPWSKFLGLQFLLPQAVYNDRPVGFIFSKILLSIFGLNSTIFHSASLAIHLFNVALVYHLGTRLAASRFAGCIAALAFGTQIHTLGAVVNLNASFDLLGATFTLLSIAFYLRQGRLWTGLSAAAFILACRSKEFGLMVFPVLVLAHLAFIRVPWRIAATRLALHAAIFIAIGGCYARLAIQSSWFSSADQVYSQVFTFAELIKGVRFYFGESVLPLFAKETDPSWQIAALILLISTLVYCLIAGWKIETFGLLGFLLELGPVLLLKNHRQNLYLYSPMAFMGIAMGALALRFRNASISPARGRVRAVAKAAFYALPCLLVLLRSQSAYQKNRVNYAQQWGKTCLKQYEFMATIKDVPAGSTIYILGVKHYLNIFENNHGYSMCVLYGDPGIVCIEEPPDSRVLAACSNEKRSKLLVDFNGDAPRLLQKTIGLR